MKIFVFCALGVLVASFVFVWLVTRIRYRIGSRHVKVLLFGIPFRRLAIADIDSVSKRRGDGLSEHWPSTFRPKHRVLVLRRRRGLLRNFVITPKNRYVFKTDLERAMRRVNGTSNQPPDNASREDLEETGPPSAEISTDLSDSSADDPAKARV
jgi:hypothetical protein